MEKKITIGNARSRSDGIVFYSNQKPGLCVTSIVTEEGEYIASPSFMFFENLFSVMTGEYELAKPKWRIAVNILAFVVAICLSIDDWSHLPIRLYAAIYFVLMSEKHTYALITTVYQMKFGKYKSMARFHAAEHKVINAYEEYGRVPTMDELRKSSPYSKNCSSRNIIRCSTIYTAFAFVMMFLVKFSLLYVAVVVGLLLLMVLDTKVDALLPMQRLVFNKPTDVELTVALKGIEEYVKLEESIMEGKLDGIEIPEVTVVVVG